MTVDPSEVAGYDKVRDGTTTPGNPIPRDPGVPKASAQAPVIGGSTDEPEDAADAGSGDSASPPGPAEEKDEKTVDNRGLTTESSPTD